MELQGGDEVFQPDLEGRRVVGAGALVEQRRDEGGEPAPIGRVECRTTGKGETDCHDRQGMVLDEPCLDARGTDHPLNGHRAGTWHPQEEGENGRADAHEPRSGSSTPVAELRGRKSARAAASAPAAVTAPMRLGQSSTASKPCPIARPAPMISAGPMRLSWA